MQQLKINPSVGTPSAAFLATRDHLRQAAAALERVTCPTARAEAADKLKEIIRELQDKGI